MEELLKLITNYGITAIITALFIWDWVTNRKTVTDSIKEIAIANSNCEKYVQSLLKNSENTAKSLDLIQKLLENQERKIDKLLDR